MVTAKVYTWVDRVGGWLLPPRCVLCGRPGSRPRFDLCRACESELPRLDQACPRCGLPRETRHESRSGDDGCPHCPPEPIAYSRCHAPFVYEFPVADLLQSLKYEGALANARVLGTLLACAGAEQGLAGTMDAVIPMPLHESRLIARGFNQSYELARFVSRSLVIPCDVRALHRTRVTQPQVGLSRSARRENVRSAFVADRARVAGRRLILLDDVITTGSTVAAAASALRSAGAVEVQAWSVARALA